MATLTDYTQHYFAAPDLVGDGTHGIAYLEWGDQTNSKVIFCVHGLTRNAHDFDYLAAALAEDYRVIAMDVAGRGQSDYLQDPMHYQYTVYMHDALSLLEHHGLKRVDWIGTSMGGILGMMVAALHPQAIARLVINDICSVVPAAALKRIVAYAGTMPDYYESREAAEAAVMESIAGFGISDPAHLQHMLHYGIKALGEDRYARTVDPHILDPVKTQEGGFNEIQDIDLSELWKMVKAPVLLLRGAESDVLPAAIAERMKRALPATELIEFSGVGHAPALMDDDQIERVRNWLEVTPKI